MTATRNLLRPLGRTGGAGTTTALPGDLLEQSLYRIAVLSVVAMVLSGVLLVALLGVGSTFAGVRGGVGRPLPVVAGMFGGALAMFLLVRWRRISTRRRLDIGAVWLVLMCVDVGLFRHWVPYAGDDVIRGPSPITVIIVLFAMLIPMRPRRMVMIGLAAACTDPLALWLTTLMGNPWPQGWMLVWLIAPGFVAVAIGFITSRIIYQLGASVKQARELGSYRLIERLGEGGMGEVWLAQHRMLARPAAVKLVKPEALGARDLEAAALMLRRFEREAQATATLQSHHTIELYDFGIAGDGTFYYVMELLDGMNLDDLVRRFGAMPPARVAHVLMQICHSLRDAHFAGVIHRDVKPANIFICRKGPELDYVKVLDFGLVRHYTGGDETGTRLTADGAVAGTPAYMAPEVATGDHEIDHRVDIYALGCVAYFMLTGRDVFGGKSPMQVILAHVQKEPTPLSQLVGELPPVLEEAIASCLAKKPGDRPSCVDDLMASLAATGLLSEWTQARAAAWWDEHGGPATEPAIKPRRSETGFVFADTMPNLSDDETDARVADR